MKTLKGILVLFIFLSGCSGGYIYEVKPNAVDPRNNAKLKD